MKHYCGNYSDYQFGRTYTCKESDWQCPSCQLLDAEDRISKLEDELEAIVDQTREECAKRVDVWDKAFNTGGTIAAAIRSET